MAKKGSTLRFSSAAAMPATMRAMVERQVAVVPVAPIESPRRAKYGNTAVVVDGIRFDSKREARYYEWLKLQVAAGEVAYFLRQVPFHLPGGTKLVVDFLVFRADGTHRVVDAKGVETKVFRIKRREVEHHYPIKVELV